MLRILRQSAGASARWPAAALCVAAAVVAGIGLSWPRSGPELRVEPPPFLQAKPREVFSLRLACRNESSEPMRIVGMQSICTTAGCASSDALPVEIGPGQQRTLAVEFIAPLEGAFEYPMTLYYDRGQFRSLTIPIRGVARTIEVGADARVRKVAEVRQGATRVEHVDVRGRTSGRIARWRTSCECVTIEPCPLDVNATAATTVKAKIDMSKDDFVGALGVSCEGLDESGQVLAEFELRFNVVK